MPRDQDANWRLERNYKMYTFKANVHKDMML
jgi:hypothetical protein